MPGVEWNTGNLGQGLSAGAGFAAAAKLKGDAYQVFVGMGDGEQQKGQVAEARRFAAKFNLDNLIAFVDVNRLQIGGKTDDVMPMDLAAQWRADGWQVLDVEGHDFAALYAAFRTAVQNTSGVPIVLLLHTTMGFGVSEIEDDHNYHGQALSPAMASRAFAELGAEDNLEALAARRKEGYPHRVHDIVWPRDIQLDVGTPETYGVDVTTDCRSAYGKALEQLGALNNGVD